MQIPYSASLRLGNEHAALLIALLNLDTNK